MVLRIGVGKLQRKHLVIEAACGRKDHRVVLGFRRDDGKKEKPYGQEVFSHIADNLSTQKFMAIAYT